ncbi:MAG: hypothetical protein ACJ79H_21735 [Myxococcales bacterium]
MSDQHIQAFVRLRSGSSGELLVPAELRQRLAEDAKDRGTNLTEVVVSILAKRYGVECEVDQRDTKPSKSGDWLNLRLPLPLYQALELARIGSGRRSYQDELRGALCVHYGLRMPAKPPRRRRSRIAPAAA